MALPSYLTPNLLLIQELLPIYLKGRCQEQVQVQNKVILEACRHVLG